MKIKPFAVISLPVILAIVVLLLYFLSPSRMDNSIEVRLAEEQVADISADSSLNQTDRAVIEVNPETLIPVLKSLRRIESYTRTLETQLYWSGGSRVETITVYADSCNFRIETISDSGVETVLLLDDSVYLQSDNGNFTYNGKRQTADDDRYQELLTYENILTDSSVNVTEASYGVENGLDSIYITYTDGNLGYRHECVVDIATGLLMSDVTSNADSSSDSSSDGSSDGSIVYSMKSGEIDCSVPDKSLFDIESVTDVS